MAICWRKSPTSSMHFVEASESSFSDRTGVLREREVGSWLLGETPAKGNQWVKAAGRDVDLLFNLGWRQWYRSRSVPRNVQHWGYMHTVFQSLPVVTGPSYPAHVSKDNDSSYTISLTWKIEILTSVDTMPTDCIALLLQFSNNGTNLPFMLALITLKHFVRRHDKMFKSWLYLTFWWAIRIFSHYATL